METQKKGSAGLVLNPERERAMPSLIPKFKNQKGEYNMSERHTGRVYTVCPECGKRQWVEVTFPSFQEPFEDTTFHCEKCGIELELTDPHQFDEHGNIIN